MKVLNNNEVEERIIYLCKEFDKLKYEDIFAYNVQDKLYYTDYVLLITANSNTQLESSLGILKNFEKKYRVKNKIIGHKNIESGWIIYDYSSFVIHVFTEEKRNFYKFDELFDEYEKVGFLDD